MGRVLALDYGSVRIGVALSDSLRITAQPFDVIPVEDIEHRLPSMVRDVDEIIVGLPTSLDGTEGPSAEAARSFAKRVEELTGIPVQLVDERFTTVEAQRALLEGGVRRSRRKEVIDKVAATLLLEGYLGKGT
ncbi:MAG: Holliday junction resolvase RuvX [Acidimicrobiia bacterium]